MDVQAAIRDALPKARITPLSDNRGYRVQVLGAGRGRAGGAWALVLVNHGTAQWKQGLVASPIYDDPDDLAKDLKRQFSKTSSTYV